jgi:DMSO/TMAO reductase YedYZ molybdopterin-dependent catalytic subunit
MLFLAGCVSQEIKELQSIEIKDYEGEKLDSVGDFRENSIKGPQYVNINNYNLEITGLAETPKKYSYDEVLNHTKYKKIVKLDCVEGWSANILWEGILVRDLLEEVKPLPEANTIIFYAYDGYSTSFPLEYVQNNDIIMAYKLNDVILPPERGYPFQLIAESKWGYKWIKWITKIELSDNEEYEGYWERRGYSNTGDLNKSFFGK